MTEMLLKIRGVYCMHTQLLKPRCTVEPRKRPNLHKGCILGFHGFSAILCPLSAFQPDPSHEVDLFTSSSNSDIHPLIDQVTSNREGKKGSETGWVETASKPQRKTDSFNENLVLLNQIGKFKVCVL